MRERERVARATFCFIFACLFCLSIRSAPCCVCKTHPSSSSQASFFFTKTRVLSFCFSPALSPLCFMCCLLMFEEKMTPVLTTAEPPAEPPASAGGRRGGRPTPAACVGGRGREEAGGCVRRASRRGRQQNDQSRRVKERRAFFVGAALTLQLSCFSASHNALPASRVSEAGLRLGGRLSGPPRPSRWLACFNGQC